MVDEKKSTLPFGDFLFLHVFRSFRMAIQPSKLAIAFAALAVICLAGWLMDLSQTVVVTGQGPFPLPGGVMERWPQAGITELDAYLRSEAELQTLLDSPPADHTQTGVFRTLCGFTHVEFLSVTAPMLRFDIPTFFAGSINSVYRCARTLVWAFKYHTIYSVVFFAVILVALSLAGGAICRIAALQFARDERPGWLQTARFAGKRFVSLVAAPIAPFAIAILLGLPITVLGLIGNIPVAGELLTGILFPLALVAGPFIAVVLIGVTAGLNLMTPAIAYEDSDFFDAISRSFSNVYARPWRMAFYTLAAAVYGAACYLFVRFFAFLVLWVTHGFLQLGLRDEKLRAIWPAPVFADILGTPVAPDTWSLWLAAFLIRIWVLVVVGLTISFVISFYFSANTIIYALMRNRVDGTGLDEVHVADDEAAKTSE